MGAQHIHQNSVDDVNSQGRLVIFCVELGVVVTIGVSIRIRHHGCSPFAQGCQRC
jgi:hypothetical protein